MVYWTTGHKLTHFWSLYRCFNPGLTYVHIVDFVKVTEVKFGPYLDEKDIQVNFNKASVNVNANVEWLPDWAAVYA